MTMHLQNLKWLATLFICIHITNELQSHNIQENLRLARPPFGGSKINYNLAYEKLPSNYIPTKKPVCVILYMAGDNDLRTFLYRNVEEIKYLLKKLNNNDNFHFFIHIDSHNPGQAKNTLHLMAYGNSLVLVDDMPGLDSGNEDTLVFTYQQAMAYCPADKVVIGLWNHGTGDLNPLTGRTINPSQLYKYDTATGKIALDRSIGFFDFIEQQQEEKALRGICFDESSGNFLSNTKVGHALETICTKYRNGKPIEMLFCDACLMSGIGFIHDVKPWTDILVSSQEVILATGYRYDQVLTYLAQGGSNMQHFAQHIVEVFKNVYSKITHDYTLSAINMHNIEPLYATINTLAETLIVALQQQRNNSVRDFVKRSCARNVCTSFNEPSYKDLKHLLTNFINNIESIQLNDAIATSQCKAQIKASCTRAIECIQQAVIANASGKNLASASGISIYLPEKRMHQSFQATTFAQKSSWLPFITAYLAA